MATGIKISLDIDESQINKAIGQEIVSQLNQALYGMANDGRVRLEVGQFVENQIKNTPEFVSLLSGDLSAIFGLTEPRAALDNIIDAVKNSIQIEVEPAILTSGGLSAGITVSLLRDDFSDVIALSTSSYESGGERIDWLRWLLLEGDKIVIVGYDVVFGSSPGSRTGDAYMRKSRSGFRVPPEFSGTNTSNWLTRAFEDAEEIVGNILFLELNRRL